MANLQFLRGTHSKLKSLSPENIKDGAFYLTEDTHRLYVGQATGETNSKGAELAKLIDLNKYILDVASINDLPSKTEVQAGDFYYCVKENVLARYQQTGTNTYGWVQINPDTSIQNVSLNAIDTTTKNKVSSIINITETRTHEAEETNPIYGTEGFGIRQTFAGQNISVKTDKPLDDKGQEASIDSESYNGTITFIGDTYDVSTEEVDHDEEAYNTTVDLSFNRNIAINDKGESETISETVRFTGDNGISLTSKEKTTTGVNEIVIRGTSIEKMENKFIEVSGVTGIEVSVYDSRKAGDSDKNKTATAFVPTVSYGQKNDSNTRSAISKVAKGAGYTDTRPVYDFDLDVYTISEIDNMLDVHTRTADAMRYIGTVSSVEALPTEKVQIGDTYKMNNSDPIIEKGEDGSVIRIIKTGDLFIASGSNTEDENGNISNNDGKIIWDWVPAGNDTYKGYTSLETVGTGDDAITHANFSLVNGENNEEKVATFGVRATDKLHVEYTAKKDGEDSLIYTIKHDTQAVLDANASKKEIDQTTEDNNGVRLNNGDLTLTLPVLTKDATTGKLNCDEYGHITGFETQIINLTHNHLDQVSTRAENPFKSGSTTVRDPKKAITYIKTKMEDANDEAETYFELNTSHANIEFSAATDTAKNTSSTTINLVWGTF